MYKFLVVGLGGSGGKTLQFLMNSLGQELERKGWSEGLPECWQFVHIDLPPQPDGIGPDLPPTVPAMGGTYIQVASANDSYRSLDKTLEQRLANYPNGSLLRALAPWRPDVARVNVPIQYGAGQYRAVGRIATLAHAAEIYRGLSAAADRVTSTAATTAQQRLATLLGSEASGLNAPPIVLVVSSLAGGTGASMTLDVCNLLRAIPGIPGGESIAFLYTPEVFHQLAPHDRAGIDANALGTASELLAALAHHATRWTDEDWAVYGGAGAPPLAPGRGPRAVIPIGARTGNVLFGDGSINGIFAGTARAVAAMLMSPAQTTGFFAYAITNFQSKMQGVGDNFGFDVEPDGRQAMVYGFLSMGFGSIGLGRDRYSEYVAQRLARRAVDRLLFGHRDSRIERGEITEKAALEQRVTSSYEDFLRWTNLRPVRALDQAGMNAIGQAVEVLWPDRLQQELAMRYIGEISETVRSAPHGTGVYYADMISDTSRRKHGVFREQVSEQLKTNAERWVAQLQASVEAATIRVVAEASLAVAAGVLDRFYDDLLASSDRMRSFDPSAAASRALEADASILRSVGQNIQAGYGQVQKVFDRLRELYFGSARSMAVGAVAVILPELATGVVRPLRLGLLNADGLLRQALHDANPASAAATVRTEAVSQWPSDGPVPQRFATATNEVLLEDAASYASLFDRHIVADNDQSLNPSDAALAAVVEIIALVAGESRASSRLRSVPGLHGLLTVDGVEVPTRIGRKRSWWPEIQQLQGIRAPATASYTVSLDPASLLDSARQWVLRPNTTLGRFVSEGLRTHLTADIGSQQLRERQEHFMVKLQEALLLSRPLANYDVNQLQEVHTQSALNLTVELSEIPLGGTDLAPRVKQALLDFPNVDKNDLVTLDRKFTMDESRSRIDILVSFPPLSPIALTSLQLPIRQRWQEAQAADVQRKNFWQWRRSRSLVDFVPVLPGWLDAMVLGWMVGRLTGDVVIPKESGQPAARVYDPNARAWFAFGNPLLGVDNQARLDAWTLLAALLESLPLAMARACGDPSFRDLVPYRTLKNVGAGIADSNVPSLETWVRTGLGQAGQPCAFLATCTTPQERLAATGKWLDAVLEQFRTYLPQSHERYLPGSELSQLTVHNFSKVTAPAVWEIANVVVGAADALARELTGPQYLVDRGQGPTLVVG
jgi:hypothetical protein